MKNTILTLLASIFVQTLYAQWMEVKLPRLNQQTPLISVEWPDSSTGYVFDLRGVYYKTTDAGTIWTVDSLQPRPSEGFSLRYADFITPKFGIASFQWRPGLDSLIYFTTDGGTTWTSRLIPLKNASFWGSTNMPYSRIRLLGLNRWFLHYMIENFTQRYAAEQTYFSSDQGLSWFLLGEDTLREGDLSAMCYIVLDSLHQYKFYVDNYFDSIDSWVRTTTDGGKTWWRIRNPSNPLAEQYYRGMGFKTIHTISDTGIAIVAQSSHLWPPGGSYGLVTTDIRYKDMFEGWESFALPWFGSATADVTYNDGILYAVTNSSGPVGYNDSLWIRNVHNSSIDKGFNGPRIWDIWTSSRDMLWGLTPHGGGVSPNRLYRFDRRLVSVMETKPLPTGEGMRMYPNPMHGKSEITLTYELAERVREATISIYDVFGRNVSSISLGERNRGPNRDTIDLSSLAITVFHGLYVIVLSTPYKVLSSTTAIFF